MEHEDLGDDPGEGDRRHAPRRRLRRHLRAFPNPARGPVVFTFAAGAQRARLQIFDVMGRHVRDVFAGLAPAGEHAVLWDGTDAHGVRVANGIYLARLAWQGGQLSARVTLHR